MVRKIFFCRMYPVIIFVLIVSFAAGYVFTYYSERELHNNTAAQASADDKTGTSAQNVLETVYPENYDSQEIRVSAGAELIFKSFYIQCNHTVFDYKTADSYAGMTETELSGFFSEWTLEEFESDNIRFVRVIDGRCPKHFVIKTYNGSVAVLYNNGKDELKEITSIFEASLKEEDRLRLAEGVYIDSEEELAQMMEDLDS